MKVGANKKIKHKVAALDPDLMIAFNRGFSAGAKEQRKSDIENLAKILEELERMPGIGSKTAWKVRELFMQKFGRENES